MSNELSGSAPAQSATDFLAILDKEFEAAGMMWIPSEELERVRAAAELKVRELDRPPGSWDGWFSDQRPSGEHRLYGHAEFRDLSLSMIRLKAARLMAEAVAAQQQLDGLVARIGFALSELDIRAREYDSLRQEINPQQSRQ